MKISIFSDCHCGFDYGEERGEDSFSALQEAIEKSLDSDLILIAGDLFDSKIPKQEVFARTAKMLSIVQHMPSKTKFTDSINKKRSEISPLALRGIPIIAIHGTHERRAKQMINPVQALEHAGLLIHLHASTVVFKADGKKVAVHGMSGVPERYAKEVLTQWNPKPIEDAINILMLHQSIDPFIYSPLEPPSIKLEDLPEGFDLYVLGHLHWHKNEKFKTGTLLLTGSTMATSVHSSESKQKKCIFKYDGKKIEEIPLDSRDIYYESFEYSDDVKKKIEENIQNILKNNSSKKPVIFIKIIGKLKKGEVIPSFSDIESKFSEKGIIKILKNLQSEDFEQNIELLRALKDQRLSVEEQGLQLLRKNLDQTKCGINIEEFFDLLMNGEVETVFNLLTGEQKTIVMK